MKKTFQVFLLLLFIFTLACCSYNVRARTASVLFGENNGSIVPRDTTLDFALGTGAAGTGDIGAEFWLLEINT